MVLTAPLGPYELRIQNDRLFLYRLDMNDREPLGELRFQLEVEGKATGDFRAVRFEVADNGFDLHADLWDVITLDIRFELRPELFGIGMNMKLINPSEDMTCRLNVGLIKLPGQNPRWMVPGVFYKYNRVAKCTRIYPMYDAVEEAPERMISKGWSFRADRASTPVVFTWTSALGAYILTDERVGVTDDNRMGIGMTGLWMRLNSGGPEIGVSLPYTETPVKYSYCHPERTAPEETYLWLEKGAMISWEVFIAVGPRDLHSYNSVLRANGARVAPANSLRPWMGPESAESLASEGLRQWHVSGDHSAIYETASFDKYYGKLGGYVDRTHMHVGWMSGASVAYPLLWRGYDQNDTDLIETARLTLDRISEGLTPMGVFWPEWTAENEWSTGRNPQETWMQARTIAEAVLYLVRALRFELLQGTAHPNWLGAIRSNLDAAVRLQREDGNFGSYYDVELGEVVEWEGGAGLAWVAALAAGHSLLHDGRYRSAAVRAGDYYSRFVEDEFLYGMAEDHYLTPSSEDGYYALISYVLLYELDRDQRWLGLARRAADWALSYRFTYNVAFSKTTLLGMYDYRTRGADVMSPASQALHSFGLMAYRELVKLTLFTGDNYYRDRAEEQRLCYLQLIAREDGDFGARKGMAPDQIYHTDWWQPKGRMLALSHAGCCGGILYANLMMRLATGGAPSGATAGEGVSTSGVPSAPIRPPTEFGGVSGPGGKEALSPEGKRPSVSPAANPLGGAWSAADPRETREIQVKWKIF